MTSITNETCECEGRVPDDKTPCKNWNGENFMSDKPGKYIPVFLTEEQWSNALGWIASHGYQIQDDEDTKTWAERTEAVAPLMVSASLTATHATNRNMLPKSN